MEDKIREKARVLRQIRENVNDALVDNEFRFGFESTLKRYRAVFNAMIESPEAYATFYEAQDLEKLKAVREYAKQMKDGPLESDDEGKFVEAWERLGSDGKTLK